MTELKTDVCTAKVSNVKIVVKDLKSGYTHIITRETGENNEMIYELESFYKGETKQPETIESENPVETEAERIKREKREKQERLDKEWLG